MIVYEILHLTSGSTSLYGPAAAPVVVPPGWSPSALILLNPAVTTMLLALVSGRMDWRQS